MTGRWSESCVWLWCLLWPVAQEMKCRLYLSGYWDSQNEILLFLLHRRLFVLKNDCGYLFSVLWPLGLQLLVKPCLAWKLFLKTWRILLVFCMVYQGKHAGISWQRLTEQYGLNFWLVPYLHSVPLGRSDLVKIHVTGQWSIWRLMTLNWKHNIIIFSLTCPILALLRYFCFAKTWGRKIRTEPQLKKIVFLSCITHWMASQERTQLPRQSK